MSFSCLEKTAELIGKYHVVPEELETSFKSFCNSPLIFLEAANWQVPYLVYLFVLIMRKMPTADKCPVNIGWVQIASVIWQPVAQLWGMNLLTYRNKQFIFSLVLTIGKSAAISKRAEERLFLNVINIWQSVRKCYSIVSIYF